MPLDFKKYIKYQRFPAFWCAGCPSHVVLPTLARAFAELDISVDELVIISGIGCSGRLAGYYQADTIHTLHGRTLPVAEGVKAANPKLHTVVVSGDGDLLSIGGNHLIHAARRNHDIAVFMLNNQIYGMTGGQAAPTLRKKGVTVSTPEGSDMEPLNIQGIITSNKKHFFGRTSAIHPDHLLKTAKAALAYRGFSFVEIIGNCFTNYGRRAGFTDVNEMAKWVRDKYRIAKTPKVLSEFDLGVLKS